MQWAADVRFLKAISRLLPSLKRDHVGKFRRLKPIAFLCGGATDSAARHKLREYLRVRHPRWMVFYADHIWQDLVTRFGVNALQTENWLAKLSDAVLIVVESPGAIAELGAFALNDALRKKLLLVVDKKYSKDASFINTGPVAWVAKESEYSPVVVAALSSISRAYAEIEERLGRHKPPSVDTEVNILQSPKHLLFALCDLVAIFGPVSCDAIDSILVSTIGKSDEAPTQLLLSFGVIMKLLGRVKVDGVELYYRRIVEQKIQTFMRVEYFKIEPFRAEFLGMMGKVEAFQTALRVAAYAD